MKLEKCFIRVFFVFVSFFIFMSGGLSAKKVKATSSLGKTNFIIGADSKTVLRSKRSFSLEQLLHIGDKNEPIMQVFFTPDDDMRAIILGLIACEKKSIYIAAFLMTDHVVAQALVDAHSRGIKVQLVTDKFCCKGKYGKARLLYDGGIDVLVYRGIQRGAMSDLMHNKFIVFKENLFGRSIVWTGSFNFTNSARLRNQENVLLLDNQSIVDRYTQHFDVLKSRCVWYARSSSFKNSNKISLKRGFKAKSGMRLHPGYKDRSVEKARGYA